MIQFFFVKERINHFTIEYNCLHKALAPFCPLCPSFEICARSDLFTTSQRVVTLFLNNTGKEGSAYGPHRRLVLIDTSERSAHRVVALEARPPFVYSYCVSNSS